MADVGGNPITTQAFNHWLLVAAKSQASQTPGSPVIVPDPPQFNRCVAQVRHGYPTLAKVPDKQIKTDCKQLFSSEAGQVMQLLIQGYWYELEAVRDHVSVSNAQVQKAFETAKAQHFPTAAEFNAYLSETGETIPDLLFQFRVSTLQTKLVTKLTKKVTPSTIQQYYNSHRSQFGTQQSLNLRIVLTKTQSQANTAKQDLQKGESWSKVTAKYSIDPTTKKSSGLLVGMIKGQEDPALTTAAFSAPLNKLLGPVKGQFGYYVFEVIKATPATQQSLTQATPLIRQTLLGQEQTAAANSLSKVLRAHWLSQTKCQLRVQHDRVLQRL